MATAIEYGCITVLVAVAAVAGLSTAFKDQSSTVKTEKTAFQSKTVLIPYKDKKGIEYRNILVDVRTECQYLVTSEGEIVLLNMKYVRSSCPPFI